MEVNPAAQELQLPVVASHAPGLQPGWQPKQALAPSGAHFPIALQSASHHCKVRQFTSLACWDHAEKHLTCSAAGYDAVSTRQRDDDSSRPGGLLRLLAGLSVQGEGPVQPPVVASCAEPAGQAGGGGGGLGGLGGGDGGGGGRGGGGDRGGG